MGRRCAFHCAILLAAVAGCMHGQPSKTRCLFHTVPWGNEAKDKMPACVA
jgi:hypothetical protein